jgi:hypothetical protein
LTQSKSRSHTPISHTPPVSHDSSPQHSNTDDPGYLKKKDFNYTMNLMDAKLNSIYKLCRLIGDQQRKDSNILQKLASVNELSSDFWNVSYFNIFSQFYFEFRDA